MMITTTRNETFFKVEMTAEQAMYLQVYFQALSISDIDAPLMAAKIQPGTKESASIHEVLAALSDALMKRGG